MKREIYLRMLTLEEAKGLWFAKLPSYKRTRPEKVSVGEALGRVTRAPVFARWSYPSFHSAAMDGIATRAELTFGASERNPILLEAGKDFQWINTGQPLEEGFDCVIMVEKLHQMNENLVEIRSPATPWQHVRKVGEDVVASELLLTVDHLITPYDLGVLAACGVWEVDVWKRPKVYIIPTGSELIGLNSIKDPEPPPPPKVIESNSLVLKALVEEARAEAVIGPIVPDDLDMIKEAILRAISSGADLVMINAGSSAGAKDFTVHAIRDLGEVLVHGVAMMPGKPTILGMVNDIPVVGNPGYPVSAVLSFREFVRPLLLNLQGITDVVPNKIKVRLTRPVTSKPGIDEFVRVNIGRVLPQKEPVAIPLPRAAGSLTSLQRAEGMVKVARNLEGYNQEELVEADLLVEPKELEKTLVIIGSHDMTVDIIADELKRRGKDIRLISSNVGSLGGILAIKRGHCHMAGTHLLDPESGEYNRSYVQRYLKDTPLVVFHLVGRDQGFLVKKGNPKGIRGISDLTREDVTFVNRQAGSGTRVLFDYELQKAGIEPDSIKGYQNEEYTHMAVAVDVKSGVADTGIAILAAAKALDLDFIPLAREQYDIIIPKAFLELSIIQDLLSVIRSQEFRQRVIQLGGYDASHSGQVFFEQD